VQYLPIPLRDCEGKLALPLPRTNFPKKRKKKKTVLAIVVQCCGTPYLPICGKHKLLLVLNPAAGVSFLIINKSINHTAFMENRHFVIDFIFAIIRFN